MSNLSSVISEALSKNEFTSYNEFEKNVLAPTQPSTLLNVLSTSLRVNSIGQAFSVGYRGALQCLLPSLDQSKWAAFCVSEAAGAHPKALTTMVSDNGELNGAKSFVSMADAAEQLIVIAVAGEYKDRPLLKAVLIELPCDGVTQTLMPAMNMMPDVRHGGVELKQALGRVLPGDGHSDYNKRFRTIEDAHLLTAFTGLVLSKTIRYKLDSKIIDSCLLILSSLMTLEFEDTPWNVFQLFGAYEKMSDVITSFEAEFNKLPESFQSDWMRDKKIFTLSAKHRLAKRDKALSLLEG